KEIVEDASTRARPGEDGTGQPVKCGPPARKTGTRRAAAVEERAGQGIASAECSHGGRAAATANEKADKKGLQTWFTSDSIRVSEVKVENVLLIDENWCIFAANEEKSKKRKRRRTQKSVVERVAREQPPPQPTSGILKNHLHFTNGGTSAPGLAQTGSNQGPGAALNHHQSTQPRTLPPPPPSSQHHQQQHQSQQPTQSQQQSQQQPPSKDAQSKYSPRIEHHHHHPQPGQYLPPSSQYPAVNNGQSAPVRQRISDDEFLRLGPVEMLKFVRKTESDIARLAAEQNRQIQNLLNELRLLKEANQRLNDDNQELRDLCCFLDDDRQKGRKLAREWQRFGRYTVSVMRQEVSAYQNNCESLADQTMQYVRSLEQRVKQLEEDKSVLQARAQGWEVLPSGEVWDSPASPNDNTHLGSRPEAVVRALQVLEVREQLEREEGHDGEKALVREMCNVVWRKLEEGPQARH
ncbi:Coiled-coil domain-containing protein 85A, partial [Trachymyrmex zeteki]